MYILTSSLRWFLEVWFPRFRMQLRKGNRLPWQTGNECTVLLPDAFVVVLTAYIKTRSQFDAKTILVEKIYPLSRFQKRGQFEELPVDSFHR